MSEHWKVWKQIEAWLCSLNAIDDIEKLIQSFNFAFLSSCKPFQTSCLTVSSGIYCQTSKSLRVQRAQSLKQPEKQSVSHRNPESLRNLSESCSESQSFRARQSRVQRASERCKRRHCKAKTKLQLFKNNSELMQARLKKLKIAPP